MLPRKVRRDLSKIRREKRGRRPGAEPARASDKSKAKAGSAAPFGGLAPVIFPVGEDAQDLEGMVGGGLRETDLGAFWLIEVPLVERWSQALALHQRLLAALASSDFPEDLALAREHLTGGLVFLDIETTGLSSEPVFLVGALEFRSGEPTLCAFLARDYGEEAAMLEAVGAYLEQFPVIVTFNGKSFDMPYIHDRMRYHRLRFRRPRGHLDLLHTARRRWRHVMPDCKLQTLEQRVCGRVRADDLPGKLVPKVYREFVISQDAGLVAQILQHNALDLLTLVELLAAQLEHDAR